MREVIPVKCSIVRGGTSKGIFIMENELPRDPELRDKYILEIFGSPDVRQIDGLGGADVLTSKLAIIGPSSREDADVDYTFGQVSFVEPKIDYKSNCGNISAGVAPFAINNGIVKAVEPYTTVRIHQVNTDTIINAKVEVRDGKAAVDGDFHIDGVPTLGSTIELDFSDSVGGITGKLLPTDNVVDTIVTDDGKSYEVSVVDAGIPTVFIEAKSLDMSGIETPQQIEGNAALMTKIEEIRGRCAVKMGFTDDYKNAVKDCPYAPFFAIVSPSQSYHTFDGKDVKGEDIDTDWAKGYSDGAVAITALGESCAEGTQEKVDEAIAAIKAGTLHVFDINTFTVDGKKVESCIVDLDGDFKTDSDADKEAIWDGYFHESELRAAPSFTLRIDGITELNAEG